MTIFITVRSAGFQEDVEDEALEVGFSEHADGSGRSVLINHSTASDALDAPFGMDSYCVSNEQGVSDYGGVEEVRRDGRVLTFRFSEKSAEILGMDVELRATFEVTDESFRETLSGLRRILSWGRQDARPELVGF